MGEGGMVDPSGPRPINIRSYWYNQILLKKENMCGLYDIASITGVFMWVFGIDL